MGLKCFNRHRLYDVATRCRSRKYPSFDRLLSPSRASSRVSPPNDAFIDLRRCSPVIARNHTRGRYERKSADAHFFPESPHALLLYPYPQHLPRLVSSRLSSCLVSFLPCPGAASAAFLRRRYLYAQSVCMHPHVHVCVYLNAGDNFITPRKLRSQRNKNFF